MVRAGSVVNEELQYLAVKQWREAAWSLLELSEQRKLAGGQWRQTAQKYEYLLAHGADFGCCDYPCGLAYCPCLVSVSEMFVFTPVNVSAYGTTHLIILLWFSPQVACEAHHELQVMQYYYLTLKEMM
jgi:hypothetical protein